MAKGFRPHPIHPSSPRQAGGAAPATAMLGPGFGDGRWCACREPRQTLVCDHGGDDPWTALQAFCEVLSPKGGVVGMISYEAAAWLEPTLRLPPDPQGFPVLWAQKFDHLDFLEGPLFDPTKNTVPGPDERQDLTDPTAYAERVRLTQRAIRRGDIFQANISRPIDLHWTNEFPDMNSLFADLVGKRPAAYAAFLPIDQDRHVLSNSPELFLSIAAGQVVAEPVKGTCPRGRTEAEDQAAAEGLRGSRKDRAENIMIADLLRNDLAKICIDHSIEEEEICSIRSLSYVHHLYSRIRGRLAPEVDAVSALKSCFPCGSITGAPKWRAMEIIAAIEGVGRGPYCGAIFLLRPNGDAVVSVPIRTATIRREQDRVHMRARFGGGITTLSNPAEEYTETCAKASALGALFS